MSTDCQVVVMNGGERAVTHALKRVMTVIVHHRAFRTLLQFFRWAKNTVGLKLLARRTILGSPQRGQIE